MGVEEDEVEKETMQGLMHCAKRLQFRQEGKRSTRLVFERSTKARGDAATTSGCKFKNNDDNECRCNANDDMMNANKQINNTADTQDMEGV